MRLTRLPLSLCLLVMGLSVSLRAAPVELNSVPEIPGTETPQILYWFWTPKLLEGDQYLKDIDRMAARSRFTLVFITGRDVLESSGISDQPERMKPFLEKAVARAHSHGLKLGLQLWPPNQDLKGRFQAYITDGETTLDADGQAVYRGEGLLTRAGPNQRDRSELLKVYVFQKTGDGFYAPASLKELTAAEAQVTASDAGSVTVHVSAGKAFAGETVFVMTAHYYRYGDMFSDYFQEKFAQDMEVWRDIPFDGMALDEFKYVPLEKETPKTLFRSRSYSPLMAEAFQKRYRQPLERALFDMRYAPQGAPEVRALAINRYFDLLCFRPQQVDQAFGEYAKKVYGPSTFIGFHNTYHNSLTNDEIWTTGDNWWNLTRDYGQLDENLPDPVRLGVSLSSPKPVFYNMYYSHKPDAYIDEAARDARINGREHYHAYDDMGRWGQSFLDDAFLDRVTRVEKRIRLLNQFDGPRADSRVLILFGFPALVNWYPNEAVRNKYDINGSQEIVAKSAAAWNAGYPCALVSSAAIDQGRLTLDAQNRPVMQGHTFDAVVFLNPEYSKEATLSFLEKYTAGGGKLMLEGTATRDFECHDIRVRFTRLAQQTTVNGFSISGLAKLGVTRNWPKDGSRLEDGSVLLIDRATIENDLPYAFSFSVGSDNYSGVCSGLLAFKAGADGKIDKLASARFARLQRNGQTILEAAHPVDLVLKRDSAGAYHALVAGDANPGLTLK